MVLSYYSTLDKSYRNTVMINELVNESHLKNKVNHGIWSSLYVDRTLTYIFQVLEGERDVVERVFQKILKDPRHRVKGSSVCRKFTSFKKVKDSGMRWVDLTSSRVEKSAYTSEVVNSTGSDTESEIEVVLSSCWR